jgi:hypothetical protein
MPAVLLPLPAALEIRTRLAEMSRLLVAPALELVQLARPDLLVAPAERPTSRVAQYRLRVALAEGPATVAQSPSRAVAQGQVQPVQVARPASSVAPPTRRTAMVAQARSQAAHRLAQAPAAPLTSLRALAELPVFLVR